MGRVYIEYFEGSQFYFCMDCKTHLTNKDELFSKVTFNISKLVELSREVREGLLVQQSVSEISIHFFAKVMVSIE